MRNYFNFNFIYICIVFLFVSCETNVINDFTNPAAGVGYPVTEKTESYSVTYLYKDNVIVLDQDALKYLIKVEADTILYFSIETPTSILPKIGDVISARVTDKTPYGLGNIVLNRAEQDSLIQCITTITELDNIFEELSWDCNVSITDSILSGYLNSEGNYVIPSFLLYDEEADTCISIISTKSPSLPNKIKQAEIGCKKLITFPIKLYSPEHGNFNFDKISGEISIGAFIHCSGDIKKDNFNFYIQPIINIESGLKIGISYNKNLYQDIFEWSLFKLKDIIKGVIQLGPVTLRPYVDVEVYIDFGASGTIEAKIGKTFSAKIGYMQKNGAYITNSTSDGPENKFIKDLIVDGNVSLGIRCLFDIGCGLYTKKIALALDPYFTYSLGTDCRLTGNEDAWTINPKLNFDIKVGADGRILVNWFGKSLLSPSLKFFDINVFHKEWPLLPSINQSSLKVERDKSITNALVFNAQYDIKGGLLSAFTNIYPEIEILQNSNNIYYKTDPFALSFNKKHTATFKLEGLQEDNLYTAIPSINFIYRQKLKPGYDFICISPKASITDIQLISAQHGNFTCNCAEDTEYEYEYKYYVESRLLGSENCIEWGIAGYSCNGQYYHPYELKDGVARQYWTAWSNSPSHSCSYIPYVKLLNGEVKTFEPKSAILNYGNSSSGTYRSTNLLKKHSDVNSVMRLDSIVLK